MWVDARVPKAQMNEAMEACLDSKYAFHLDLAPPASGPEVEFSVQDVAEDSVRATLIHAGVTVLAIRTRDA